MATLGQPPGRHPPSLLHKLEALQRCGRAPGPLFAAVPHSGLTPIEDVLDEAADLKSAVLLGFTRDGCHLVSYTTQPVAAADGQEGYSLQLWSFVPGARCRRLWSVPLFRTQPYLGALADEDGFLPADDMLLTVAEAPNSSLLVVHGRSADPAEGASREALVNYLTLIPGPTHAGALQLQVAHLSYTTAFPHAPFNPYHFLAPLESTGLGGGSGSSGSDGGSGSGGSSDLPGSSSSDSPGGVLAVALYTGGGVRYLHAGAARQPLQAPPSATPSLASPTAAAMEEGEEDSSTSNFPSPDFAAPAPMPAESEGQSPAPAGQRGPAQPPAAMMVEPSSPRHQLQQQHQHQRHGTPTRRSWPPAEQQRAASPAGSPWPRLRRRTPQRPPPSPAPDDCELGVRYSLLPCAHAAGRRSGAGWQPLPRGCVSDVSGRGCAAVICTAAAGQLDVESCIYAALQRQGVPAAALLDYAAAPVQACCWEGREGLLLLVVLRLARDEPPAAAAAPQPQQQQQPGAQQAQATRSACVLLHAAAADGQAALVEWLEPPYPWHDDLSAFLVQQTAFAGLAFEKAPAFFADFMRARWGAPPARGALPLVLSNRSVLGSGQSLAHIAHPFLPQAILGYGRAEV